MRRILISLFAALLAGSLLQAQTLPSLLVNADAAALGAGGSAIAADATAFALENNTAAIPFSDKTVFAGVSYGLWQPSSAAKNQIAFSGWWNSGKRFAAGLYAKTFRYPSYTSINENGVPSQVDGPFSPSENVIGAGASFRILEGLSVGVTGRMAASTLAKDAKATAYGAVISVCYKHDPIQLGLAFCNVGTKVSYGEDSSYPQPMMLRAGLSYRILEGLKAQAEADWLLAGGVVGGAGVEYCWNEKVIARTGYHIGTGIMQGASFGTLGLGCRLSGFCLDAAWVYAGANHRNTLLVTLGYAF